MLSLGIQMATAQSLEPRLYSNAPVGLNFLVVGYGYSQGALADNPSLGLEDPKLDVNSGVLAYARVFEAFGQSAKANIVLPSMCIDGSAQQEGQRVSRHVCGVGDVKARLSFNLFGAPALSLKEYASYRQDTIVGVNIQVTAPTGQYDSSKAVNISTNRWALKTGVGVSKAVDDITFELAADVELYSENREFLDGSKRRQEPVYSTQAHIIYDIGKGIWIGLDANYYWGGEQSNDGVAIGDPLANSRLGVTLALPVSKKSSIKLYGSSGISTRTGTDFDALGLAWQYRWADGS